LIGLLGNIEPGGKGQFLPEFRENQLFKEPKESLGLLGLG